MGQQHPQQRKGKTVVQKDAEFVDYIQKVLGFRLMPWQIPLMANIRKATETGKELPKGALCACMPAGRGRVPDTHGPNCPERLR